MNNAINLALLLRYTTRVRFQRLWWRILNTVREENGFFSHRQSGLLFVYETLQKSFLRARVGYIFALLFCGRARRSPVIICECGDIAPQIAGGNNSIRLLRGLMRDLTTWSWGEYAKLRNSAPLWLPYRHDKNNMGPYDLKGISLSHLRGRYGTFVTVCSHFTGFISKETSSTIHNANLLLIIDAICW